MSYNISLKLNFNQKSYIMKKNLLGATFFFLLSITFSYAQDYSYGARIGANITSISSDNIPANLEDNRFGFVVGFLAEMPITEKLSLQPELQYSEHGNDDKSLQVNYLQLPIFLKYNFN